MVYRNPSAPLLYELSMSQGPSEDPTVRPDSINSTGALVAYSGKKCGYYLFITHLVVFLKTRELLKMKLQNETSGGVT